MEQGAVLSAGARRSGRPEPRMTSSPRLAAAAPQPAPRDHDLNPDLLPDRPLTGPLCWCRWSNGGGPDRVA